MNPPRRQLTPLQIRYLAVAWMALTIIIGICAFAVFTYATGGRLNFGGGPATPVIRTGPQATVTPVPTAGPPPTEGPSPTPGPGAVSGFGYGIQVQGLNFGDPGYWTNMTVSNLHLNWIKQQVEWGVYGHAGKGQMDWSGYDGIMNAASQSGLKVMVSVVGAPEWSRPTTGGIDGPPENFQDYADFVGEFVERYQGKVHAIEVWNEQNLDRDWKTPSGRVSAADYVRLLQLTYGTIKAKDPSLVVISGALSPTGYDDGVTARDDFAFLQEMVAAGVINYADCVGVHHNGYNIGPRVAFDQTGADPKAATATFRGPFDNPHHSWSMYTTVTEYRRIVGEARPLCITEFGWPSREGLREDLVVRSGFEFANDNTAADQANYIVDAYNMFRDSGYVKLAFLFNLNLYAISDPTNSDNVVYSILNSDGGARPAFEAIANMPKP